MRIQLAVDGSKNSLHAAADMICEHAAAENNELICMGLRGLGATANPVMGSVATKVLHRAEVPVPPVK